MKLSFIGCGNMARAMISGILDKGLVKADDIYGSNATAEHAIETREMLGIHTTTNNAEAVEHGEIVFLCVKPQQYSAALKEIAGHRANKVLVTIAPGKSIAWVQQEAGLPLKVVRTMPNTPALVGMGYTSYCANAAVEPTELERVEELLSSFSTIQKVDEHIIDAASAVAGSAPAFTYIFIEALADGAVAEGMTRDKALAAAAHTVMGSAKMVLESGKHPAKLKDEVCSPGGSTIAGVQALEDAAFRGAVMEAIRATAAKARSL